MAARLLSIDFGHVRIGVSISDPMKIIASPFATLEGAKKPVVAAKKVASQLEALLKKHSYKIEKIIIGLPIHLSGEESTRSQEVREFAKELEVQMKTPVTFFDERLTSVQAERSLKEAELSRKKRTTFVDAVSSTILLQCFLDLHSTPRG